LWVNSLDKVIENCIWFASVDWIAIRSAALTSRAGRERRDARHARSHKAHELAHAESQYLGNVAKSQSTNPYQPSHLLMVPDA